MTISAITPELVVDLDGTQTNIPFDFLLGDVADLIVSRDGTQLVRTVDYDLSLPAAENAGSIDLVAPVQAGRYVVVRATSDDQTLDLEALKRFPSAAIEGAFDKVIRILQEHGAKIDRALIQTLLDSGIVDARLLRIANVADPTDAQDAVTKNHLEQFILTLPAGSEGPPGPAIPGPPGLPGPVGESLAPIAASGVPSIGIGVDGQLYINTDNGDLYQRQVGGWAFLINLKGPAGSGGGGVTDHGALTGLSDADHPISAIAGLQPTIDALTVLIGTVSDAAVQVFRQDDAPTGTIPAGSFWFETDNGNRLHVYDGVVWLDFHDAQLDALAVSVAEAIADAATAQATADGKIETFIAANTPTATGVGDLWLKTPENLLHIWSGTAWDPYQDADIVAALTNAANAQATADGKITTFFLPESPAPAISSVGDIWFDTDAGNHPYRFNGTTWVSVQDAAINQVAADLANALTSIATIEATLDGVVNIFYEAVAPTLVSHPDLAVGDLWYNTANNEASRWDGATWVSIRDTAIAQALADSATAVATADQKIRAFYQNAEPDPQAVTVDTGDLWYDLDDSNRVYRYNGSAWVDISAITDLIGGQIGEGGLRGNAVSIQTEQVSSAAGSVISQVHASSGAKIKVTLQAKVDVDSSTAFDTSNLFSLRLNRRINGGAFSQLQQFTCFAPSVLDTEQASFEVDAVNRYRMGFSIARFDSAPEAPPHRMLLNVDIEYTDTPGTGDIEYEFLVTAVPANGNPSNGQLEFKRIDTLEIKR